MAAHLPSVITRNLVDPDRRMGAKLRGDTLDKAAAALGTGPDPVSGERVVALVVHTTDTRAGCFFLLSLLNPIRLLVRGAVKPDRFDQCWLVTDERLVLRGADTVAQVRWDTVRKSRPSGGFGSFFGWEYVNLYDGDDTKGVSVMTPAHQSVARLVRAVIRARDAEGLTRDRPPWPAAAPTDPAGLSAAHAALDVDDGRGGVLLRRLTTAWMEGRANAEEALDLARRVVLFSRAVAWGRGARDGAWVSPLRPAELRAALSSAVGALEPVDEAEAGWQTWVHEGSTAKAVGRAVAETALRLIVPDTLGIALPRTDLRLLLREEPGWTAWRLEQKVLGIWCPLSEADSNALSRIFEGLLTAEAAALVYRCVVDPRAPADEVVQARQDEILAHLAAADPQAQPERFRMARPQKYVQAQARGGETGASAADAAVAAPDPDGAWRHAGLANVLGGLANLLLGLPLLWCLGVPILSLLPVHYAFTWWGTFGGVVVALWGVAQCGCGIFQMAAPRGMRIPGMLVSVLSVLALVVGGVFGAIGGGIALWLGARPDALAAEPY